ncbi:MAG: hypothetical protein M3O70_03375 [Actinomycetota bacterium]|nr:hypothetical protein [Actinomycetota bacterium]
MAVGGEGNSEEAAVRQGDLDRRAEQLHTSTPPPADHRSPTNCATPASDTLGKQARQGLVDTDPDVVVLADGPVALSQRIHVLEVGRIVDSGAHEELLDVGGIYAAPCGGCRPARSSPHPLPD